MIPRTSAISFTTFDTKTEFLSVIITVCKYSCLVISSMITLAVLTAVGLDTGYAKAYFEKTPFAAMMSPLSPLGGSCGESSFCMMPFGPKSFSGILMSSGVNCEMSNRLSLTQVWHSFTHLQTWFAIIEKEFSVVFLLIALRVRLVSG